jgi:hypothetical protein
LKLRTARLEVDLAENIVQRSLLLLSVGTNGHGKGRHPCPVDMDDGTEFLHYLHGMISSLVDSERNLVVRVPQHLS